MRTFIFAQLLAAIFAPRLAGQGCEGVRAGRAAAIGGAVVAGQAVAAAFHPGTWWPGAPGEFSWRWGGSPAAGQDVLIHAAFSYQISQGAALAWDWACAPRVLAGWLGAATAVAAALPKEIVDGFHGGFSGTDLAWSAAGAVLPAVHRRWPASRAVALKVSYRPSREYLDRTGSEPALASDYAGQRYYLSVNPARGGGPRWWPKWLGVGLGHSTTEWVTDWPGRHVWFATLDLDLRGLPIRARWWPRAAAVLDQIHFPAPGVRLRDGRLAVGAF